MTYREAWEAIYFRHCQETCDYAYMDNCQEEKCEYYMALQALNRQYYAECGSIWTKPTVECKTKPQCETCINYGVEFTDDDSFDTCLANECNYEPKDEPQTEREGE